MLLFDLREFVQTEGDRQDGWVDLPSENYTIDISSSRFAPDVALDSRSHFISLYLCFL